MLESNTATMKASREQSTLEKFGSVISILANVTVIISLIIALQTYYSQQMQERRNVTRELVSEFNSGAILQAQMAIARDLARLPTNALRNRKVKRDAMATIIRQVEATSADPIGFQQNAILIVSFFDDAQSCIDSDICSEEDMKLRLGEASIRYACLLLPYVESVRENRLYSGLGDGLIKMSEYELKC